MRQADPLPCPDKESLYQVVQAWNAFCNHSSCLMSALPTKQHLDSTVFLNSVAALARHGLLSLLIDYFVNLLENSFKEHCAKLFWKRLDEFVELKNNADETQETIQVYNWVQSTLPQALEDICSIKSSQEDCITDLVDVLQACTHELNHCRGGQAFAYSGISAELLCKYQTSITALLLTSAPKHFCDVLNLYFKARLEDFSRLADKHTLFSRERSDSDKDGDAHNVAEGYPSENDDLESIFSSRRTSGCGEDMEINGSSSSFHTPDGKSEDPAGVRDMEGIVFPCLNNINAGAGGCMLKVAQVAGSSWVKKVTSVVRNLQQLGFSAMTEEACASAIYSLLKDKIYSVATKHYEKPVLAPIRRWIKAIPLQFLHVALASGTPMKKDITDSYSLPSPLVSSPSLNLGSSNEVNERAVRWHLRLEFFAYETLGDLRISELFDIIVDYPESLAAIEDLRQCLANTGHHTKLVESFRTALRHRLLTAGAATTDILLQYISTIKALRTMDHTGVFLEAVGEPIREYLRGRKDTIRCIVTMLTEDTSAGGTSLGGVGESLLEELSRGSTVLDNLDSEDEGIADDEEAWATAERWEPDPVEADPSRTSKSRRSMDIIGMLIGIYGSKELFVNEYRIMLAEKLLNKSDYDIDHEIRTLELLKLRFGESSMHSCEIMLKDIADSKRINSNIKASVSSTSSQSPMPRVQPHTPFAGSVAPVAPSTAPSSRITDPASRIAALVARARGVFSQTEQAAGSSSTPTGDKGEKDLSLDILDATIISSLFWPPFQAESMKVPDAVDQLLEDYSQRYHALKAPRKLQWKKHLGIVKLELQFEDHAAQFMVSPMHASIIMQFEGCASWAATDLAAALGVPVTTLRRRIMLWVNQGVLVESSGAKLGESYYTIVENMGDVGSRSCAPTLGASDSAVPLLGEEEGESAVASMEDQLQQEMNVYESYVLGMLTNFDALPLDRIHNMLKMFVSDPPYDKSLHQLQSFLAGLVSEEKLEIRDGLYRRRQ